MKIKLIFFLLLITISIFCDIKIIQEVKTEILDTKSGIRTSSLNTQTKWIKGKNIFIIDDDYKIILSLSNFKKKNNKIIFIDKKKKEFFKTNFPLFFSKLLPKELLAIRINQLPKFKVKKLDFNEKVGKYNCKRYNITLNFMMMMMKIKVWTSDELYEDISLENPFLSKLNSIHLLKYFYPDLPEDKNIRSFYNQTRKIRGFWIKSEIEMDLLIRKITITSEIKEISKENAPINIFSIPKKYKELNLNKVF